MAHGTLALKAPQLKLLLALIITISDGHVMPEADLGLRFDVPRRVDHHRITDKSASGITVAGLVDVRRHGPNAARVESFFCVRLLDRLIFDSTEVGLAR